MTPHIPIQVIQVIQVEARVKGSKILQPLTNWLRLDHLDYAWIIEKVAICRAVGSLGSLGLVLSEGEEF